MSVRAFPKKGAPVRQVQVQPGGHKTRNPKHIMVGYGEHNAGMKLYSDGGPRERFRG